MVTYYEQLDQRFKALRPLARTIRPSRGWVRAIREALGMTTRQLGARMDVSQPRIVKLEKSEVDGSITLDSLERAAQALGCRVIYALMPERPLAETMQERANKIASRRLAAVEQTMRLEDQEVMDVARQKEDRQRLIGELLQRPARLWDEP